MLVYWWTDLRWHRDPVQMLHGHIDMLICASESVRGFVDMLPHWRICVMTVTVSPYYITSIFIMTWWLTMTHLIWTLLVRTMCSTPRTNQVCAYKCADDKRKSAMRKTFYEARTEGVIRTPCGYNCTFYQQWQMLYLIMVSVCCNCISWAFEIHNWTWCQLVDAYQMYTSWCLMPWCQQHNPLKMTRMPLFCISTALQSHQVYTLRDWRVFTLRPHNSYRNCSMLCHGLRIAFERRSDSVWMRCVLWQNCKTHCIINCTVLCHGLRTALERQ